MVPTHNTECGSNWIGYVIHHAPGPMMAVWPTQVRQNHKKNRLSAGLDVEKTRT
jgi:phage terminase large subunit GpA-like protein